MDRDRRLAYLILKDIETEKTWSNLAVSERISSEGANSERFVRELVYGTLRNRFLLDYNINLYLKKPSLKTAERIWLRMGFYQLCFMDGVAEYAAINETVELARSFKKGCEKFINAILRNFQRDGKKISYPPENDFTEYLSVRYSFDKSILHLWLEAYGKEKTLELLEASNTQAPFVVRVNTEKTSRSEVLRMLKDKGVDSKECKLADTALELFGSGILDTDLYKNGYFSVQGESSQYAAAVLDPKPGELVLDLCAAPGGKTFAMAEKMNNIGKICAFDAYEHRVALIERNAKRLGHSIVKCECADATVFMPEYEGIADCVLVDAPCSGLGTLRRNPEIKFRPLEKNKQDELISMQKKILENAYAYLKPGGKLLYSTCTINPSENELQTKAYPVEFEKQIFTSIGGPDGFYVCLIKKK